MTKALLLAAPSCALAIAMLPACGPPPSGYGGDASLAAASSSAFATSELVPVFAADDEGDDAGVQVTASLRGPAGEAVQLTGGDALFATVGTQLLALRVQPGYGPGEYAATFPSSASGSVPLTIAFDRALAAGTAPSSTSVIPAPFTVTGPSQVQVGQSLVLPVQPPATPIVSGSGEIWTVAFTGLCFDSVSAATSEGSITVDANGALAVSTGAIGFDLGSGGSCSASLLVQHWQFGPQDPGFAADPPVAQTVNVPPGADWVVQASQSRTLIATVQAP
jgi:hypothetical protein